MGKKILPQPRQSLYAGEPRQRADSQNAPYNFVLKDTLNAISTSPKGLAPYVLKDTALHIASRYAYVAERYPLGLALHSLCVFFSSLEVSLNHRVKRGCFKFGVGV